MPQRSRMAARSRMGLHDLQLVAVNLLVAYGGPTVTIDPTPDLPDGTLITDLNLPTRIRNALERNGFKTVGEVRETSDQNLLSLQDMGWGSVKFLRSALVYVDRKASD
jgi:hypothetical protein